MIKILKEFYFWQIGFYENKMDNESNENKAFYYYCKMEKAKTKYHNI